MKIFAAITSFSVAGALLTVPAVAQTRYCIGGDLQHLSQAEKASCSAKMHAVREVASALHAPEDWHFVVVCGEGGWEEYSAYTSGDALSLAEAAAQTDLDQHETFFRESRLDPNNSASLRRVVAHEVAGILLRSKDEVAISNRLETLLGTETRQSGL